jgi:hypothetical protein
MSDIRKASVWPWIVALLIGLPVLYLVTSGPMRTVALRKHPVPAPATTVSVTQRHVVEIRIGDYEVGGQWWSKIYRPLIWASGKPWGAPLNWYWRLFPIRSP